MDIHKPSDAPPGLSTMGGFGQLPWVKEFHVFVKVNIPDPACVFAQLRIASDGYTSSELIFSIVAPPSCTPFQVKPGQYFATGQ